MGAAAGGGGTAGAPAAAPDIARRAQWRLFGLSRQRVAIQNAASGRFLSLDRGGEVVTLRSPAWLKLKAVAAAGAGGPGAPANGQPAAAAAAASEAAMHSSGVVGSGVSDAAPGAPAPGLAPPPALGTEDDSLKSPLSVTVSAKGGIVIQLLPPSRVVRAPEPGPPGGGGGGGGNGKAAAGTAAKANGKAPAAGAPPPSPAPGGPRATPAPLADASRSQSADLQSAVFGAVRLSAISVSLSGWVLPSGLSKLRVLAGVSLALDWTDLRSGTALPVLAPWPVRVEFDASPALPAAVYVEADVARLSLTDAFLLAGAHSVRSFGQRTSRPLSVFVFRNHTPSVVRFRVHGRSRVEGHASAGGHDDDDAGPLIEVLPGEVAPFDLPASLLKPAADRDAQSDSDLDADDAVGSGTDGDADGPIPSATRRPPHGRRRRRHRNRRGTERAERQEAVAAEGARAHSLATRRRMWVEVDGWGVAADESFGTFHARPLRVGGGRSGDARGSGGAPPRAVLLWTVSEDVNLCINVAVHAPLQLFNRLPGHTVYASLDDGWGDADVPGGPPADDRGALRVGRGGVVFAGVGASAPSALRVRPGSVTKAYGLSEPVDVARMRPGTALVVACPRVSRPRRMGGGVPAGSAPPSAGVMEGGGLGPVGGLGTVGGGVAPRLGCVRPAVPPGRREFSLAGPPLPPPLVGPPASGRSRRAAYVVLCVPRSLSALASGGRGFAADAPPGGGGAARRRRRLLNCRPTEAGRLRRCRPRRGWTFTERGCRPTRLPPVRLGRCPPPHRSTPGRCCRRCPRRRRSSPPPSTACSLPLCRSRRRRSWSTSSRSPCSSSSTTGAAARASSPPSCGKSPTRARRRSAWPTWRPTRLRRGPA